MIFVLYNTATDEFLQVGKSRKWGQSFFYAKTFNSLRAARKALNGPTPNGTTHIVSYRLIESNKMPPTS